MDAFVALEQQYPEIIRRMKNRFNAHTFILELAHEYQGLYIQALSHYVNNRAPFQVVHGQLAKLLNKFPELVYHIPDDEETSTDIFGYSNTSSVWFKR